MPMFVQFAVSTAMLVICVMVHGAGLFSLSRATRSERSAERLRHVDPLSLRGAVFTLLIVLAIFVLHGIEIWLFALLYLAIGAVDGLENALYFSTISYSTVGYSDTHATAAWRLLGPFESILGIILLGWSTAFFFRVLGRIDPH
jgi:predicted exporter